VVADDGTLVYVSSASVPGTAVVRASRLVWVDRLGRETPVPAEPRAFGFPRLSPDGTRIAVFAADQARDLWVWDLSRGTLRRVTFDPDTDVYGEWTPDSRRLIFSSQQEGVRNIFSRAADGTGGVERLTESPNQQNVSAVSPDGGLLIFSETVPETGEDVMQLTLDGTRRVTPLVHSSFSERNGVISPDGRWLAYQAND
jgi:Tol biopolymer transport system component